MSTARMMIESVSLWCPCGEFVPDPYSGSSVIAPSGAPCALRAGQVVACGACGERLRIPASFAKVGVQVYR